MREWKTIKNEKLKMGNYKEGITPALKGDYPTMSVIPKAPFRAGGFWHLQLFIFNF
jgi:hypothetical protein